MLQVSENPPGIEISKEFAGNTIGYAIIKTE